MPDNPTLSIVVIFHNMKREAARTLHTLSTNYQSGVSASDYEIIAIDNNSSEPLSPNEVSKIAPNIRYHFFETESVSPVAAVNFGVESARGEFVAVIVDGARMVTPGLVGKTLRALQDFKHPFVCSLGWHLGPDVQRLAIPKGYSQAEEDALLKSIDWHNNGYRLFDISTIAPSSKIGFLGGMPTECSWFAMPRSTFLQLGGFDIRFQSPGGGLVNQDFLQRALAQISTSPIVILGEGSFHQMHGGIATNSKPEERIFIKFTDEYMSIHGAKFARSPITPTFYYGDMPSEALRFLKDRI